MGKSPTQLLRLCMVFKSLNIAIEILENIPNKNVETPNKTLEENIIKAVQSIPQETYSIDIQTANYAKAFLDYCNLSKIVLGGYIVDPMVSISGTLTKMLQLHRDSPRIAERFSHLDKKFISQVRRVLFTNCSIVEPIDITNGNIKVSEVQSIFLFMEEQKIGKCRTINGFNNKPYITFSKITTQTIENDIVIGYVISDLGINILELKRHLLDTEENDANELKKLVQEPSYYEPNNKKRKESTNKEENETETKRRKIYLLGTTTICNKTGLPLCSMSEKAITVLNTNKKTVNALPNNNLFIMPLNDKVAQPQTHRQTTNQEPISPIILTQRTITQAQNNQSINAFNTSTNTVANNQYNNSKITALNISNFEDEFYQTNEINNFQSDENQPENLPPSTQRYNSHSNESAKSKESIIKKTNKSNKSKKRKNQESSDRSKNDSSSNTRSSSSEDEKHKKKNICLYY